MTKVFTLTDLFELPIDDHSTDYYEILGGRLVVLSAPDEPHSSEVIELLEMLLAARRAGYGDVRTAPRAVALDFEQRGMQSEDVPQPDIFFVRRGRVAILRDRAVYGVPDLVIEILSRSTRRKDRPGGEKWRAYERNKVPYYWIVDTTARTITQYEFHDGVLRETARLQPGDVLSCPLFPDISREVGSLFTAIGDDASPYPNG